MLPRTYAKLVDKIESILLDDKEVDNRPGIVHPTLAEEMAKAAKTVYDAAMNAQIYADQERA